MIIKKKLIFFPFFSVLFALTLLNLYSCGTTIGNSVNQNYARATGIVYERKSDVAYTLSGPFTPVQSEALVAISSATTTSDATGIYTLTFSNENNFSLYASKTGFITTKVSEAKAADTTYNVNLGLYEAVTVNPRPGFLSGIITWDAGGWINDFYFPNKLFQATYTNIKDNVGAQCVSHVDPVFVTAFNANAGTITMSKADSFNGGAWKMLTKTEYTAIVNDAHQKGLEFMMWFGVIGITEYDEQIWNIPATNTAFWDAWFTAYQTIILEYAQIAKDLGVEYISLGHDMNYVSKLPYTRWESLINAIRSVGYTGKICYFGTVASTYYESDGYNNGDPSPFVNLFDYIGINIDTVVASPNPTPLRDQLKNGIQTILAKTDSFPKPILVMVRTPATYACASDPTFIEPLLWASNVANNYALDLYQQADVYQALFEVINATPVGNGKVMGVLSWGYNYLDNYHDAKTKGDMAMDKSGNIRGKPAEAVCKYWFNTF